MESRLDIDCNLSRICSGMLNHSERKFSNDVIRLITVSIRQEGLNQGSDY